MTLAPYEYIAGGAVVSPIDSSWSLLRWQEAMERGPGIRPVGSRVVVLVDPSPEKTGSIYHPDSAMGHVVHTGTVLAVPMVDGRPGWYAPKTRKAVLEGGAVANVYQKREGYVFHSCSVRPGDRIVGIRFMGMSSLLDDTKQRLRVAHIDEIYGHEG